MSTSPLPPSLFCIPAALKRLPSLDLLEARKETRGSGMSHVVRFPNGDVVGCITDDMSKEEFCFAGAIGMQTATDARSLALCLVEATRCHRQFLGIAAVRDAASSADGADYFVLCVQVNAAWGKALLLPGGNMKHAVDLLPMSGAAVPGLVSVVSCKRGDVIVLVSSRVQAAQSGSHRSPLGRLARAAEGETDCESLTVGQEPAADLPLLCRQAAFRAFVASRVLALKPISTFHMAADVSFPVHVGNLPVAVSIGSTAKQVFILVQLLAGANLNCVAASDGRYIKTHCCLFVSSVFRVFRVSLFAG